MAKIIPNLVSTIIPVYNRPQLLAESVNSVLAQTYRPIEVIIVDDGSTDNTSEVGKDFAGAYPGKVIYIRQANQGVASARNAGIKKAKGEFIQFLDSDDLLMPEKFTRQVTGLLSNPDCGISYCYTREYRPEDGRKDIPTRRTGETFFSMFPEILFGRFWGTPTPLYRRTVIEAIGFFRNLSIYEDWEYECRAAAIGVKLQHCKEFLADIRLHGQGRLSKNGLSLLKLKDYARVHELIFEYARQAKVEELALDRFSRTLFFIARRCAAAGFKKEAKKYLNLAQQASIKSSKGRTEMVLYKLASQVLGWQSIGKCCQWFDKC